MPFGSEVVVMLIGCGATVSTNIEETNVPVVSVTRAVKTAPPACAGVPERKPALVRVRPAGSEPPVNNHV